MDVKDRESYLPAGTRVNSTNPMLNHGIVEPVRTIEISQELLYGYAITIEFCVLWIVVKEFVRH